MENTSAGSESPKNSRGNVISPPTSTEHQMVLFALIVSSKITTLPITKESIDSARESLDTLEKLFNRAVEERLLGDGTHIG